MLNEAKELLIKIKNIFQKIPKKLIIILGIILVSLAAIFLAGCLYWNQVILKADTNLKIGVVTDWEYGKKNSIGNKLTKMAYGELEKVVKYFNEEFKPEIVIECGDMVESSLSKKKTTIGLLRKINALFSTLDARRGYVVGNHDVRDLSKEEIRNILEIDYNHTYFDIGDWRLVIMDTSFNEDGSDQNSGHYIAGFVPESEFNWLKEVFQTERPVILFSHHSPIPDTSQEYFPTKTKNLNNALETHNFLKQFENLVLVVSGHQPSFHLKSIEGINYLIVDNLANKDSIGSFASMEANYNKYFKEAGIKIEHHGPSYGNFEINKQISEPNWKNFIWKK